MKSIFAFMLIAAIVHSTYGITADVLRSIIAKDQDECLKKAPVSQEVRDRIKKQELVEDDTLKKYALCMQVLIGFMNPDGSYNPETIKHTTADLIGNNQFDGLVDQCTANPSNDATTNAWNLAKCAHNNVHVSHFFQFSDAFWALPH